MRLQKTTLYLFPLLLLGSSPLHGASWSSPFFAPDEATTLHNMGVEYDHQGKYEEALKHYLRALEIKEKKLGVDHPDVATTLNNIGLVYDKQGKYAEALPYYEKALEIDENKLGEDHPSTITTRKNVEAIRQAEKQYLR